MGAQVLVRLPESPGLLNFSNANWTKVAVPSGAQPCGGGGYLFSGTVNNGQQDGRETLSFFYTPDFGASVSGSMQRSNPRGGGSRCEFAFVSEV